MVIYFCPVEFWSDFFRTRNFNILISSDFLLRTLTRVTCRCEKDVDECERVRFGGERCRNGGKCGDSTRIWYGPPASGKFYAVADKSAAGVPGIGAFVCTCAAGWSGPTCEVDIDSCASSPCVQQVPAFGTSLPKNDINATCYDLKPGVSGVGGAGYACACPNGYGGALGGSADCSKTYKTCLNFRDGAPLLLGMLLLALLRLLTSKALQIAR